MRAVRGRVDDAFAERQAVNNHVEEAAHNRAQHEHDNRPEVKRDGGPIIAIENCLNEDKWISHAGHFLSSSVLPSAA